MIFDEPLGLVDFLSALQTPVNMIMFVNFVVSYGTCGQRMPVNVMFCDNACTCTE